MHDPIAAGRRSALRAVALQAAVSVLVALAFLVKDVPSAVAAAIGGGALAAGNAAAAWLSLRGIERARAAFARLLAGMAAKWCVAIAILAVAMGIWRLPPLPMLCGLTVGLLVWLLAMNTTWVGRSHPGRRETKG